MIKSDYIIASYNFVNFLVMVEGIIYKFTILVKYKFYGYRPFYIGQHIGYNDFNEYWGSGRIWNDFLKKLKNKYPTCWRKLIKREVLFKSICSQRVLDKMEEYYIKKENAHYSNKLGGCNVLLGTANKFGSGSPMVNEICKIKLSNSLKKYYKTHKHPSIGLVRSNETKEKLRKSHIGYKHNEEIIKKIVIKNKGKKRTKEFCDLMKKKWNERKESGWTSPCKNRKVPEEIVKKRTEGIRKYYSTHSSSFLGKHHTEESKRKIGEFNKKYRLGMKFSEETKKKMSESAKIGWEKRRKNKKIW